MIDPTNAKIQELERQRNNALTEGVLHCEEKAKLQNQLEATQEKVDQLNARIKNYEDRFGPLDEDIGDAPG